MPLIPSQVKITSVKAVGDPSVRLVHCDELFAHGPIARESPLVESQALRCDIDAGSVSGASAPPGEAKFSVRS